MTKKHSYYRGTTEISEAEALDRNNCLRDGVSTRVRMQARDARMTDLQRSVAADAANRRPVFDAFGHPAGHRPGFAFVNDAASRRAKAKAYADYDAEIQRAWQTTNPRGRSEAATGAGEHGQGGGDWQACPDCNGHDATCSTCNGRATQLAVRDAAARDARARAYELYDQEIQPAWRNTDPRGRSFESTGFGSSGPRGQSEGDACTIDGRSGHLKMVGGHLQCVPDKTDAVPLIDSFGHRPGFAFVNDAATREARARMYALKDVEYENAWRGPNATCPSCQGSGEADDGSECETCRGEGVLNAS